VSQCVAFAKAILWQHTKPSPPRLYICVALCCSLLPCVAVVCFAACCCVLLCVAVATAILWQQSSQLLAGIRVLHSLAIYYYVLQQCVLPCIAVCCSVLQCVAVCRSVLKSQQRSRSSTRRNFPSLIHVSGIVLHCNLIVLL